MRLIGGLLRPDWVEGIDWGAGRGGLVEDERSESNMRWKMRGSEVAGYRFRLRTKAS
jgi:hypothetical protein